MAWRRKSSVGKRFSLKVRKKTRHMAKPDRNCLKKPFLKSRLGQIGRSFKEKSGLKFRWWRERSEIARLGFLSPTPVGARNH
jgi:hypothetical protein